MSEAELEAEYARLSAVVPGAAEDDGFAAGLDDLEALSKQLNIKTDDVQLIREERDWHANRVP